MPLNIPSRRDVSTALQTYVRSELPGLDPTPQRRSKIGAWTKSLASALFDWYVALKDYGDHEPFPQSARGDFLFNGWWRPLTKLDPIPASPARGAVVFTGMSGTAIPGGTRLSANGVTYTTESATSIVLQTVAVESVSYDAIKKLVIVTTINPHQMASGQTVTVSGSSNAAYAGQYTITATDDREFTYKLGTVPGGTVPASFVVASTWALATVAAGTTGQATNVGNGGKLTVLDAIPGVQTQATATFGGIQGGSDVETAESYRKRILQALGTDRGAFTSDEIKEVALEVPGVTRVWVRKASLFGANGVNEGQVKIAFMRDLDVNPIPSAQEVADVKRAIVDMTMTANTAVEDVIVLAPTPLYVDVRFSTIKPDTVTMREAITASLVQFFAEQTTFGTTVPALDYQCAIKATFDMKTRTALQSFTLSAPKADIVLTEDQIPLLRSVTFGLAG